MAQRRIIRATTCRAVAWRKSTNTEHTVALARPEAAGTAVDYRVSRAPAHDRLVGFGEDLHYRPNPDFVGCGCPDIRGGWRRPNEQSPRPFNSRWWRNENGERSLIRKGEKP